PRASPDRFCGTMCRSAPARSSTNASSPTASSCPEAASIGGRSFCRAPTAQNREPRRWSCMADQRTAEGIEIRDRIDRFLRGSALADARARVVPLTGDASDRKYFRIIPSDGPSIVLALHAGPIEFSTLPLANVCTLFERIPLPVPGILGHSDELGIVALQDLGDVTLQAHLGAASPSEHAALYRQAVRLVELLQRRGDELRANHYIPYTIAFDVEKLTWELNFFLKHFVEGYRGVVLATAQRDAFAAEW